MNRLDATVARNHGYNLSDTLLRGGRPVLMAKIVPAALLYLAAGMSDAEGRRFRSLAHKLIDDSRRAA